MQKRKHNEQLSHNQLKNQNINYLPKEERKNQEIGKPIATNFFARWTLQ